MREEAETAVLETLESRREFLGKDDLRTTEPAST
jgi:hypothetical protein